MKIKTVEIKNFRSIKEGKLDFCDLTAIIGRNGTGKSSYLHAIEFFYNLAASVIQDDFYNRDTTVPIEIRITFSNLKPEEISSFSSFMNNGFLSVTKRFIGEGRNAKYYAATPQISQFTNIRLLTGKKEKTGAWNSLIESQKFPDLITKVRAADEIEPLMVQYEQLHPELTEMLEQQVQFIGPPNIGGGQLDNQTRYVLIPAVRKVTEEFSGKNGAIDQLLEMIVLRKLKSRKDILEFRAEFEAKAKKIYCSENLPELPQLGEAISNTLCTYAPGCTLKLKWNETVNVPDIQPPSAQVTLIEDNFEGNISNKGHGLQRALILTLLQHLALSKQNETLTERPGEGEQAVGETKNPAGPDLILGLEEPELYLHPSRARYLYSVFVKLVESKEGVNYPNIQVVFATHSPYFVDISHFDQIRILRKINNDPPNPMQSHVFTYSLGDALSEWVKVSKEDPGEMHTKGFMARTMPIMTSLVNEGFFADTVVVVEGLSDFGILWTLQEIMNKSWSEKGIVVVPISGKANLDRPVIIFRGFSIPTYFIFDGDYKHKGKAEEERTTELNKKYLRLSNVQEADFPETQVHEKWAVFKDCIETTIKESLGESKFNFIRDKIASDLGYESDRLLKNVEGSSIFIKQVYEEGNKIPTLEKVVEQITRLR